AREACVSKATLYSYFPDKRLLFIEVAKVECQAQSDAAVAEVEAMQDARRALTEAAKRMTRFFMSDVGLQVHRIIVGESQRFPELGRQFYESGPARVHTTLRQFLQWAVDDGQLEIDDIDLAADQFPELCKAGLHLKMLLGLRERPTEEEIDRVIDGAVDVFFAKYGAR
ncbi:MAG: TetR/AcrR family transcriptional regulator C-terminal domain-containing protein, partial [Pseudomonadota bacterium]